jgi:hypothetical protein
MTGWMMLFAACAVVGGLAFSAARLRRGPFPRPAGEDPRAETAAAPVLDQRPPAPEPAPALPARAQSPRPTVERPDAEMLALWASQIAAGTRKMTVATDGCRVTWNRTCRHGHPSWLVYLDYLESGPRSQP